MTTSNYNSPKVRRMTHKVTETFDPEERTVLTDFKGDSYELASISLSRETFTDDSDEVLSDVRTFGYKLTKKGDRWSSLREFYMDFAWRERFKEVHGTGVMATVEDRPDPRSLDVGYAMDAQAPERRGQS